VSESLSHLPCPASASPSSSPAPRPAPGPPPAQGCCFPARAARFRAGPASRVPPLARAWLLGRVPPYSPGRGARAWLLSTCSPLPSSISPPVLPPALSPSRHTGPGSGVPDQASGPTCIPSCATAPGPHPCEAQPTRKDACGRLRPGPLAPTAVPSDGSGGDSRNPEHSAWTTLLLFLHHPPGLIMALTWPLDYLPSPISP
jgi:hypothetical protein